MKFKRVMIVALIVLIICVVTALPLVSLLSKRVENRFFTHIDELCHLENYITESLSLDQDDFLDKKTVKDSFTKKIVYNGKTYTIYAYVFTDAESSIMYFNQYTGKSADAKWNFSFSSNYYFSSSYIAFYQNCLYRIEGGFYNDFVDAVDMITDPFTVTYDDLSA